jgi:uncharacterized membrane protein YwaF
MIINLTYLFVIVVAIYLAVASYLRKKELSTMFVIIILIGTLGLEISRLMAGTYLLDTNDFLRTIRDILRVAVTIWMLRGSVLRGKK